MPYSFLADLTVFIHACFVAFVVVGQGAILVGAWSGWGWARNFWFRAGHLLATLYVAAEAVLGLDCPLTVWEARLRLLAGQEATAGTFIGRCLHALIFVNASPALVNALHVIFGVLVLGTAILFPPRWPLRRPV